MTDFWEYVGAITRASASTRSPIPRLQVKYEVDDAWQACSGFRAVRLQPFDFNSELKAV